MRRWCFIDMMKHSNFTDLKILQGHPTTVFCKLSVQEKQILPRIFYRLRTAKNF